MPVNLHLAHPQRTAPARRAEPAEKEARQLPQRIETQAAGHDRVALEMAGPEPIQRRIAGNLELGHDLALAVRAAGLGDAGDALEHEHRRQGQLGVAGAEQLAAAAGQQILVFVARSGARPLPSLSRILSSVPGEHQHCRASSADVAGFPITLAGPLKSPCSGASLTMSARPAAAVASDPQSSL